MIGSPSGGTFKGNGIKGNLLNPAIATLGKNTISYFYMSPEGCNGISTQTTIVVDTVGNICKTTIYDTVIVKNTTYDTLKIKVNFTAGININKENLIRIYPNPTSNDLIIDNGNFSLMTNYRINIYDAIEKQVFNAQINSEQFVIKLSTLGTKGIYTLNLIDANNNFNVLFMNKVNSALVFN